jgi:hypothetical protein
MSGKQVRIPTFGRWYRILVTSIPKQWYWQVTLVAVGLLISVIVAGPYTTASGPAGGIAIYFAIAFYSGVLMLGTRLTRALGFILLVISLMAIYALHKKQLDYMRQLTTIRLKTS